MKLQNILDQITNLKNQILRYGIQSLTSLSRPPLPGAGQVIFQGDDSRLMVYSGTEWNQCSAGGMLKNGYAQATSAQGSITTVVDLTNLSVTVTVGTNRRIKISGECLSGSTTGTDTVRLQIQEGSTVLQLRDIITNVNSAELQHHAEVVLNPTAGSHTYKLTMQRAAGAGTVTMNAGATFPAFILVEDLGPA